jgi:hypothetical protein
MVATSGFRTGNPAGVPIVGGRTAFSHQFQGAGSAVVTQQVMRAQSPGGLATAWTITLTAWQGNLVAAGNAGVTRARVSLVGGGEPGGGGATEVVEVDYPRCGTVFNVHAVTVSVEVKTRMPAVPPAGGMPVLSGWMGEGRTQSSDMDATLTEQIRIVNDGLGFQETVPPRARAFRVLYLSLPHAVTMLQNDLNSIGLMSTANQNIPEVGHGLESSMSRWIPLHPDAAFLVISNNDGLGGVGQWSVQWLLELG